MKTSIALAVGLAFALATPAFAQDANQAAPTPATSDQQQAPEAQQAQPTDQQPPRHRTHRYHKYASGPQHYNPAAMTLTGNEPGTAAYQASNRDKYRSIGVDRAHVPGDPPVIDHSGDHATVPDPTRATITVPPSN
jgi:hypothetical protein